MIRTKQEIDSDRQKMKKYLGDTIDESVQAEEFYSIEIKMRQNQLKELDEEVCFEDTSAGQIHRMEQQADEKIRLILRELSQETGHNYLPTNERTELLNERPEVADEDQT